MERTIFKYSLSNIGSSEIEMPQGAKVIHFGNDPNGRLCVWVEVYRSNKLETRRLHVFGTGHAIPEGLTHVTSCNDGPYMWHLYLDKAVAP